MPEYLSPGIYVEELLATVVPSSLSRSAISTRLNVAPITRARSDWAPPQPVAAFVGVTPDGPANGPVLVNSWSHFTQLFGALDDTGRRNPYVPGAFLSHAVYGYFLNGAERCYVTRIVANDEGERTPSVSIPSVGSAARAAFTVRARNRLVKPIQVEVARSWQRPEDSFSLMISDGNVEERFENLFVFDGDQRVNAHSQLVRLSVESTSHSASERMPQVGTYVIDRVRSPLLGISAAQFAGNFVEGSGLEGLQAVDEVTMICCPDLMAAYQIGAIDRDGVKAVQLKMIACAEGMPNRMAILDPLPGLGPQEISAWRQRELGYDSSFAALYYPWLKIGGPDGRVLAVPPSGHVAGVWCRNDLERGPHKSPANELVRGILAEDVIITRAEQESLDPIGINVIHYSPGRGVRIWGARTLSHDPKYRFIYHRRILNFVAASIISAMEWVIFEPVTDYRSVLRQIEYDAGEFLTLLWRSGVLAGGSPREAFFVRCDEDLNPSDVRDRGLLIADLGLTLGADSVFNLRIVYKS